MEAQPHSIQQLDLQFILEGRIARSGRPLEVSDVLQAQIEAVIATELDRICPEGETLFLERLDLELPPLTLLDFEMEFPMALQQALRSSLQAQVAAQSLVSLAPQSPMATASASETRLRALQHYLVHGHFPWWFEFAPENRVSQLFVQVWQENEIAMRQWVAENGSLKPVQQRIAMSPVAQVFGHSPNPNEKKLATGSAIPTSNVDLPSSPPNLETPASMRMALETLSAEWEVGSPTPTGPQGPVSARVRMVLQYFLRFRSLPAWAYDLPAAELTAQLSKMLLEAKQEWPSILERATALPQVADILTPAWEQFLQSTLAKGDPLRLLQQLQRLPAAVKAHPALQAHAEAFRTIVKHLLWVAEALDQGNEAEAKARFWELPPETQPLAALYLEKAGKPWDLEVLRPLLQVAMAWHSSTQSAAIHLERAAMPQVSTTNNELDGGANENWVDGSNGANPSGKAESIQDKEKSGRPQDSSQKSKSDTSESDPARKIELSQDQWLELLAKMDSGAVAELIRAIDLPSEAPKMVDAIYLFVTERLANRQSSELDKWTKFLPSKLRTALPLRPLVSLVENFLAVQEWLRTLPPASSKEIIAKWTEIGLPAMLLPLVELAMQRPTASPSDWKGVVTKAMQDPDVEVQLPRPLANALPSSTLPPTQGARQPKPSGELAKGRLAVVLWFLQHGSLPIWAAQTSPEAILADLVAELDRPNWVLENALVTALDRPMQRQWVVGAWQHWLIETLRHHHYQKIGRRLAALPKALRMHAALQNMLATVGHLARILLALDSGPFQSPGFDSKAEAARLDKTESPLTEQVRASMAALPERMQVLVNLFLQQGSAPIDATVLNKLLDSAHTHLSLQDWELVSKSIDALPENTPLQMSGDGIIREALAHFLEQGTLPPWSTLSESQIPTAIADLLAIRSLSDRQSDLIASVRAAIAAGLHTEILLTAVSRYFDQLLAAGTFPRLSIEIDQFPTDAVTIQRYSHLLQAYLRASEVMARVADWASRDDEALEEEYFWELPLAWKPLAAAIMNAGGAFPDAAKIQALMQVALQMPVGSTIVDWTRWEVGSQESATSSEPEFGDFPASKAHLKEETDEQKADLQQIEFDEETASPPQLANPREPLPVERPPVEPERPPVEPELPPVEPELPPVEPQLPPVEPQPPVKGRKRTASIGRAQRMLFWFLDHGSLPPWAPVLAQEALVAMMHQEILSGSAQLNSLIELALVRERSLEVVVPALVQAWVTWAVSGEEVKLSRMIAHFPGHVRRKPTLAQLFGTFQAIVEWLHRDQSLREAAIPAGLTTEIVEAMKTATASASEAHHEAVVAAITAHLKASGMPPAFFESGQTASTVPPPKVAPLPATYFVDVLRFFLLRGQWPWWGRPGQVAEAIQQSRSEATTPPVLEPSADALTAAPPPTPAQNLPSWRQLPEEDGDLRAFAELLEFVEGRFATSTSRELKRLLANPTLQAKVLAQLPLALTENLVGILVRPALPEAIGLVHAIVDAALHRHPSPIPAPALLQPVMEVMLKASLKPQLPTIEQLLELMLGTISGLLGLPVNELLPLVPERALLREALANLATKENLSPITVAAAPLPSMPELRAGLRYFLSHGVPPQPQTHETTFRVPWESWLEIVAAAVESEDLPLLRAWFDPPLGKAMLHQHFPPGIIAGVRRLIQSPVVVEVAPVELLFPHLQSPTNPATESISGSKREIQRLQAEVLYQNLIHFLRFKQLPPWSIFPDVRSFQAALQAWATSDPELGTIQTLKQRRTLQGAPEASAQALLNPIRDEFPAEESLKPESQAADVGDADMDSSKLAEEPGEKPKERPEKQFQEEPQEKPEEKTEEEPQEEPQEKQEEKPQEKPEEEPEEEPEFVPVNFTPALLQLLSTQGLHKQVANLVKMAGLPEEALVEDAWANSSEMLAMGSFDAQSKSPMRQEFSPEIPLPPGFESTQETLEIPAEYQDFTITAEGGLVLDKPNVPLRNPADIVVTDDEGRNLVPDIEQSELTHDLDTPEAGLGLAGSDMINDLDTQELVSESPSNEVRSSIERRDELPIDFRNLTPVDAPEEDWVEYTITAGEEFDMGRPSSVPEVPTLAMDSVPVENDLIARDAPLLNTEDFPSEIVTPDIAVDMQVPNAMPIEETIASAPGLDHNIPSTEPSMEDSEKTHPQVDILEAKKEMEVSQAPTSETSLQSASKSALTPDLDAAKVELEARKKLAADLLKAMQHDAQLLERLTEQDLLDWAAEEEKLRQKEELNRLRAEEIEEAFAGNAEGILIQNAGLVIIWPFLTRYFKQLGLMERGKWLDEASQIRAVFLLQYLVEFREWTEDEEAPEHLLLLNKILCGLPVETAIGLPSPITELEKEHSKMVLTATMQNWKAMAKTSIQGFQNSFLFREGFLSRRGEHWNLKVARRGYDQILTQLDWGLGVIKLPYNDYFIYTEWI